MKLRTLVYLILIVLTCSCLPYVSTANVKVGAACMDEYLPLLKDKKVALVVNLTSLINSTHLVDTLLNRGVEITSIFAPEHGFRGKNDAGEKVSNEVDDKTGLPIISLYGRNKKPTAHNLKDIDIVIFDIQDVGVRFYTYISTMHYVMEACAENNVKLIVLDRPNPNGDYCAGPLLKKENQSFVGMHPIPVVHGLTIGELAFMINEEGWLSEGVKCVLEVIKCRNWNHAQAYSLPVKPSPNLPNDVSIRLYPSLCFFEATNISIGRGTYFPFQVIGYPDSTFGSFTFKPQSINGMSKHPKQEGLVCYGIDLRKESLTHRFTLKYFLQYYNILKDNEGFSFNENWFNLLIGDRRITKAVKDGSSLKEIEALWEDDLLEYKLLRNKYLLYPLN